MDGYSDKLFGSEGGDNEDDPEGGFVNYNVSPSKL